MHLAHLRGLYRIFQYASPKGRYHSPRTILPGHEELEIIVAGRGDFVDQDEPVDVGPGGIVWYLPGDIVEVTSHAQEPYNTVVFDFLIAHAPDSPRPRITLWEDRIECARFCKEALTRFVTRDFPPAEFHLCLYARFYWESIRGGATTAQALTPRLAKALTFIEENYLRDIDVNDVAAHAGLSAPYLHQLFQSELTLSPFQLIMQKRLERAKHLLCSTDLPVKQIAAESGFRDYNNFCRMFRVKTARTPAGFRRQPLPDAN